MTIGVIGTSRKKNERRLPIHPEHLTAMDEAVRRRLVFERGYGLPFDWADDRLAGVTGGVADRAALLERCDVVVCPKPLPEDLEDLRPEGVLWGWVHCVQNPPIVRAAVERRQTLIAWEAMNLWDAQGRWQSHVFFRNNEIAGYAAVVHALGLLGADGHYGPAGKAVVIGCGSVSAGAVLALRSLGVSDITVLAPAAQERPLAAFAGVPCRRLEAAGDARLASTGPDGPRPLIEDLASADIIVNAILQDTDRPLMYLRTGEEGRLKGGCLIVDVSCDAGMGFPFARPTTFDAPMFRVGPAHYYAVDHTPSYLWRSASWEISKALLPYLPAVLAGPESWQRNETLRRAIEISRGVILNEKIVRFQSRLIGATKG